MPRIVGLAGREILDSRGRPTVLARCALERGAVALMAAPPDSIPGLIAGLTEGL